MIRSSVRFSTDFAILESTKVDRFSRDYLATH